MPLGIVSVHFNDQKNVAAMLDPDTVQSTHFKIVSINMLNSFVTK